MAHDPELPVPLLGFRVRCRDWQFVESIPEEVAAVPRRAVGPELDGAIELSLTTPEEDLRLCFGPGEAQRVARALAAAGPPIAVVPTGLSAPLGDLLQVEGCHELLRDGDWLVDRVPDGIRLVEIGDDECDVLILGTAEADALSRALDRAADHLAACPPWVLPDHLVDRIAAVPDDVAIEVEQGVPDEDKPRLALLVASHTWWLSDREAEGLIEGLESAAATGPGTHLAWTEASTFGGTRPWCTVTTEADGVVLTLCDEINEESGDDGRIGLTCDGAGRLARALRAARAFAATHPPHVYQGSPLDRTEIASGAWGERSG